MIDLLRVFVYTLDLLFFWTLYMYIDTCTRRDEFKPYPPSYCEYYTVWSHTLQRVSVYMITMLKGKSKSMQFY